MRNSGESASRALAWTYRSSGRSLPAAQGDDFHERFEGRAGFFQAQLGDTPAGEDLTAAEAVGEELLAGGLVAEDVEDARLGGDGLGLQRFVQVSLQLALAEVFLEG